MLDGIQVAELTSGQYDTVYNLLSLAIASLGFTGIYLVLSQRRVLPRYRNAIVISAMVCFIATYHYVRIFDNFKESYETEAQGGNGAYVADEHPLQRGLPVRRLAAHGPAAAGRDRRGARAGQGRSPSRCSSSSSSPRRS